MDHEERMPLGTLRQHSCQCGWGLRPGAALGQIGGHPGFGPLLQGQFGPITVHQEFLHHGAHGVRPHNRLDGTIRPQH